MIRFWRIVHNMLAHPAMEILPHKWGVLFHDWTAKRMQ